MKTLSLILSLFISTAYATQNIQEGEQSGIPDRADVEKEMKQNGKKKIHREKKEVRESQEDTDPVFYDSTTSPKEMEGDQEDI